MKKSEFSETQFVIGYLRDLFRHRSSHPYYYLLVAPSTRNERETGSDIIIRRYGLRFQYSEFYQFKRSKFYNKEVFSDLNGRTVIDTTVSNKFGFSIYNTKKTRQFNVLQKLAQKPRKRVYYCAPVFSTIAEFNRHFVNNSIENNSKVIDFAQPQLQSIRIPLGSNHKILFDRTTTHVCSDPLEIRGSMANERNLNSFDSNTETGDLGSEVKELYNFILDQTSEDRQDATTDNFEMNFFSVRDILLSRFDIHWIPFFNIKND